jgi:hypothetical protein
VCRPVLLQLYCTTAFAAGRHNRNVDNRVAGGPTLGDQNEIQGWNSRSFGPEVGCCPVRATAVIRFCLGVGRHCDIVQRIGSHMDTDASTVRSDARSVAFEHKENFALMSMPEATFVSRDYDRVCK